MKTQLFLIVAVIISVATPAAYGQDFLWVRQMGGVDEENLNDMVVDGVGHFYSVGSFEGTADFDPGAGVIDLVSAGSSDVFISRFDSAGALIWARQAGAIYSDEGWGVALDGAGNVYTVGTFADTVDFDPGPGIFNLTSAGSSDVFVLKLDGAGNFVWAKQLGGVRTDYVQGVAVDGNGDIYAVGQFSDTVDFDPGPGVHILTALPPFGDIYVWKLDSDGNFVWAGQLEGTAASSELAHDVTIASNGDVLFVGRYGGTVDFDPGPGTLELTTMGIDGFVERLDSNGNLIWAKHFGGATNLRVISFALDDEDDIHLTGVCTFGVADLDPGPGLYEQACVGSDIFFSKLDPDGEFLWGSVLSSDWNNSGTDVVVDGSGNVHLLGYFRDTVDFDPGPGVHTLTSMGSGTSRFASGYLLTLDSDGTFSRVLQVGVGPDGTIPASIALGEVENIYVGGYFRDSSDFDPGVDTYNLISAGDYDAFVWKYGVVVEPCEPDPLSQGYWHRQCIGAGLIGPGRHGRGPQTLLEPGFVDDLIPAVDARLEATVMVSRTCEDGIDAVPPGDKCEQALRAYTALLLNIESGRLQESCAIDLNEQGCGAANVGELVDELAGLINSGQRDDCRLVIDCANTVNQDEGIVSIGPLAPVLSVVESIGKYAPVQQTTPE